MWMFLYYNCNYTIIYKTDDFEVKYTVIVQML